MVTGTSNFDLKKPTNDEFYDVNVMNENLDIIDGVLQSFKDGSVVVGDSEKLDGETSEQWKNRITETGEHRMFYIAASGWYRIAKCENASGVKSCDLYIQKSYNTHSSEYYKLCISQVYNITNIFAEFCRVYGTQIIKRCRYTIEGNTHYLEIQYVTNSSNQITVDIISPITSSEVRWKTIEPILTEETVEGVVVDALYNIPENVSPLTSEGGTVDGDLVFGSSFSGSRKIEAKPVDANIDVMSEEKGLYDLFFVKNILTGNRPSGDGFIQNFKWDSKVGYAAQLFIPNSHIATPNNCVQYRCANKGVWEDQWISLLDDRNKPSGTYTGNGSTTARAINIGGVGNEVVIYSDQGIVFVTSLGAYAIGMTKEIVTFAATIANYSNGYLSVATNSKYLNESQRSYKYKVL